jgi:mRNA interferase RelE/StbE
VAGYGLLAKPSAAKEIEAIGAQRDRQRLIARIRELATKPRPAGCEKLAGLTAHKPVRQGNDRFAYAVDDARRTVDVVKAGHRHGVYRVAP